MAIGSTPPFNWVDGTDLEGTLPRSQQMCEAMQAITNRTEVASDPAIPSWTAYRYNGDVLTTELGSIPDGDALAWYYEIATGFRFRSVSGLSSDPSVVDPVDQTEYAARFPEGGPWVDGIDGETIFVDKDDSILIGAIAEFPDLHEATFYELQVILTTPASVDAQVKFYFYSNLDIWVEFFPSDGTNGFRRNGIIKWSTLGDCPNWKSDHDPGGGDGGPGYYIKITRTQDDMAVTPVPETIKLLLDPDRPVDKPGRSVNFFVDLRSALETVLVYYVHPISEELFTLASLMQLAVGRPSYNRSIQALRDLGYFDGEDLEEILKCIDLLLLVRLEVKFPIILEDAYERTIPFPQGLRNTEELIARISGGSRWRTFIKFDVPLDSTLSSSAIFLPTPFSSSGLDFSAHAILTDWTELDANGPLIPPDNSPAWQPIGTPFGLKPLAFSIQQLRFGVAIRCSEPGRFAFWRSKEYEGGEGFYLVGYS